MRPAASTRSRSGSAFAPSSLTTTPLTRTCPLRINSSAWRREAIPARAIIFCSRSSMRFCRLPRGFCHSEESRELCGTTKNLSGWARTKRRYFRFGAARTESGSKARLAATAPKMTTLANGALLSAAETYCEPGAARFPPNARNNGARWGPGLVGRPAGRLAGILPGDFRIRIGGARFGIARRGWWRRFAGFGRLRLHGDAVIRAQRFAGQRLELFEARQLVDIAEPEAHQKILRRAIKNRPAHHRFATRRGDQALLQQSFDHASAIYAANLLNFRLRHGLLVSDDRERLERRHGQPQRRSQALDEPAHQIVVLRLGVNAIAARNRANLHATLVGRVARHQLIEHRAHDVFLFAQNARELFEGGRLVGCIDDGFERAL